jgi:hypothetical protein
MRRSGNPNTDRDRTQVNVHRKDKDILIHEKETTKKVTCGLRASPIQIMFASRSKSLADIITLISEK